MTITGGFLPHGGTTDIEAWEMRVWRYDPSKNIEVVTEEPKPKRKKK